MTRWNASASTFTLLHLLLTLSPTFAAAFRFQAGHDGKSYKNHIHQKIDARQDTPNAPFAGIGISSDPGATALLTAAPTTPSLPPDVQFEAISAMDAEAFGEAANPSMTSMTSASLSSGQATITSLAPPVFPITVIQVPIYTVCPDTQGYLNATSAPSLNTTALYSNLTATGNTTANLPQIVSAIPIPVNATVLLPDGSYTTFLSRSFSSPASLSVTQAPAPNARIIVGINGCQTLYSASTTQICSTVIARGGQLPVTVSNCRQLVTFSSSSTTGAPLCNCPYVLGCPTAPTSPALAAGGGRNAGLGIAFFAAPWHEIAAGVVPGLVQVADCADESGKNCSTSSESWSVSTGTSTTSSTQTVQYAGPAIFAQGASVLTTSVDYSSVYTSTHTVLIPTIIRAAIAGITATPTTSERVVTVQVTVPQLQTWELDETHFTALVTEIVTITVPGTVRVTHTVTMGVGG